MEDFSRKRRNAFKTKIAKRLRQEATDFERVMWSKLRGRQLNGFRFRRQQPIGPYVADFYCAAARLVVELDGSQHATVDNLIYDLARTRFMEAQNLRVIRFTNHDMIADCETVIESIWRAVYERAPPRTSLTRISTLPQGEG